MEAVGSTAARAEPGETTVFRGNSVGFDGKCCPRQVQMGFPPGAGVSKRMCEARMQRVGVLMGGLGRRLSSSITWTHCRWYEKAKCETFL